MSAGSMGKQDLAMISAGWFYPRSIIEENSLMIRLYFEYEPASVHGIEG